MPTTLNRNLAANLLGELAQIRLDSNCFLIDAPILQLAVFEDLDDYAKMIEPRVKSNKSELRLVALRYRLIKKEGIPELDDWWFGTVELRKQGTWSRVLTLVNLRDRSVWINTGSERIAMVGHMLQTVPDSAVNSLVLSDIWRASPQIPFYDTFLVVKQVSTSDFHTQAQLQGLTNIAQACLVRIDRALPDRNVVGVSFNHNVGLNLTADEEGRHMLVFPYSQAYERGYGYPYVTWKDLTKTLREHMAMWRFMHTAEFPWETLSMKILRRE